MACDTPVACREPAKLTIYIPSRKFARRCHEIACGRNAHLELNGMTFLYTTSASWTRSALEAIEGLLLRRLLDAETGFLRCAPLACAFALPHDLDGFLEPWDQPFEPSAP